MSYLVKNYNRSNLSFKKGRGSFLFTSDGKKYLDFVQGIAVNSLGHSNPKLINSRKKFGMFQMPLLSQKENFLLRN